MSKRQRSTSNGRGAAQAQASATDMLRMRKELIQSRSKVNDLQDELEEKTSLYLNAIKARDQYQEKLNNARGNIDRFEEIVAQKVGMAMENERRDMIKLQKESDISTRRIEDLVQDNRQLMTQKNQLQDQIDNLKGDLAAVSRTDLKDQIHRVDHLRKQLEEEKSNNSKLLTQINNLSNNVSDILAENRQLRIMAGVPDNYGINLENIKLHDQERIEDFKKLIKVLQDDNYKLEEERAKLKHEFKLQAMYYKSNETDPRLRYKNLSDDQLNKVDKFVIRVVAGNAQDPSDYYQLKKDFAQVKTELDIMKNTGFESMRKWMTDQMQGLGPQTFNPQSTGASGPGIDSNQLNKLMNDNAKLKEMIQKLLEQGIGGEKSANIHQYHVSGHDPNSNNLSLPGQYPQPEKPYHGEISGGILPKFDKSQMKVYDKDGREGIKESDMYQHAFLQLQLQELLEINHRQNKQMDDQQQEIAHLYEKIKGYLLVQDQTYKDAIRVERYFQQKEEKLQKQIQNIQNLHQEEMNKSSMLQDALQGFHTNNPDAIANKLIESTKKNSILDMNLLRVSRKYTIISEQWTMLRREYHAKDSDMAERDVYVQERINKLKEWKASAMIQLKLLFEKLHKAVPISELQVKYKELEIEKQRNNELNSRVVAQTDQISKLEDHQRNTYDAQENLKVLKQDKEALEEEFENIKRRLEMRDPEFKWVNSILQKIASILKRAKITALDAFEAFDNDQSGSLDKEEFMNALEKLNFDDISIQELDVLWKNLDQDGSGDIDYREFVRKLERYGLRNIGKQENIMYQLAKVMKKKDIKLVQFFDMFDRHERGYITREDFKDVFTQFDDLRNITNEQELNEFIEGFWKNRSQGIDYRAFLSIFKKYEIQVDQEMDAKGEKSRAKILDATVRLKKQIFDQLQAAFNETGRYIKDFFNLVDDDGNYEINIDELGQAFSAMNLSISSSQLQQIFDSIDFDGSGDISLPEFKSDFRHVVHTSVEELVMMNQLENENTSVAYEGQQHEARITYLEEREKRLQDRLKEYIKRLNESQALVRDYQQSEDLLDQRFDKVLKENGKLKSENSHYMAEQAYLMKKEEAQDLMVNNEKLQTELTDTRAALLSYRSMCQVIGDQAKNLKLMHERKRDEHENLLEALREMQADGTSKEKAGKLYFIIMLSRWQEASVNKKYEAVVQEVKTLRSQLMDSEAQFTQEQDKVEELETQRQDMAVKLVHLNHNISLNNGVLIDEKKARDYVIKIENLSDAKTKLEQEFYDQRNMLTKTTEQLDQAKSEASAAHKLKEELITSNKDQKSQSLIEMSKELQKARLEGFKLTRKNKELDERTSYLSKTMKDLDDKVAELEESETMAKGDLIRIKEEYQEKDNARIRFFENVRKGQRAKSGPGMHRDARSLQDRMVDAADLSLNKNTRLPAEVQEQVRRQNLAKEVATHDWVSSDYQKHNAQDLEEKDALIKLLQEQLTERANELGHQQNLVNKYKGWQENDKYLGEDEYLRDKIEDHRLKTLAVAEKEQKEISDAAYQTVKTLQDMINQKNDQLQTKDDNIKNLRAQMRNQAEIHATEMNKLNEKMSLTNNDTMTKLHTIVAKHDQNQGQNSSFNTQNATNAMTRKAQEEMQQILAEKDHRIQQLLAENKGSKEGSKGYQKTIGDLRKKIEILEEQLRVEKGRTDIKAERRRLLALQEENTKLNKEVKKYATAFGDFKLQMAKYEGQKIKSVEDDRVSQLRVDHANKELVDAKALLDKEKSRLNNQLSLVKKSNQDLQSEKAELKAQLEDQKVQVQTLKQAKDAADQKYQGKLAADRKPATSSQSTRLAGKGREESKTNVRSTEDFDELQDRNSEMEQRIRELETDKIRLEERKAVVVKHPDFGTFEYIGTPQALREHQQDEAKSLSDIIQRMEAWVKKYDRITVGGIFRSLDRGRFGELKQEDFGRAFERIGIALSQSNLQKLQRVLDTKSTGYLKYGPIVQQLSGMPTKEFINKSILKLSEFALSKDLLPEEFARLLDSRNLGKLPQQEFKSVLQTQLRSAGDSRSSGGRGRSQQPEEDDDFQLYEQEIDELYALYAKQDRAQARQQDHSRYGSKSAAAANSFIVVEELVKEIYSGVQAVMISTMQGKLKRSRKYLVDLLTTRDANRDGFLEYAEFAEMLDQDLQLRFNPKLFESVILQLLDPQGRMSKIKNDMIKLYLGDGEQAGVMVDMVPTQQNQRTGKTTGGKSDTSGVQSQAEIERTKNLQVSARKLLMGFQGTLGDTLNKEDPNGDGLLPVNIVNTVVDRKNIQTLQPSELQSLLQHCDSNNYGFVIISNFHQKLLELAQETEQEVKLRRFAKSIGNQGLNLRAELSQYDRQRKGELDQVQFKRAMKQLAVPMTDAEIKDLFENQVTKSKIDGPGQLDITKFVQKVTDAQRSKPLPAYLNASTTPGGKVGTRIGQGVRSAQDQGQTGSQFENWEIEKKYKRNLEALKTEIEERNKEILLAKKEVTTVNSRVLRLEEDKQALEVRLINKNAKPPRQMQSESEQFGGMDEIQKLKDEIFHLQQVNSALQKDMQVSLRHELGKALQEKDLIEEKLKHTSEKLRAKVHDFNQLVGIPQDAIGQRETIEESRQKRIEELENDLFETENRANILQEQLFKADENNLDLKFEKENFSLQQARLYKRITDLEQYKLQSSQISAHQKNAREEELATIREQTAKITGEQFSAQGDTVKLRNKKIKSVQELETVIDTLRRVIDKQKVEMDNLRKTTQNMKDRAGDENSAKQAQQLRRQVDSLEQALHSAEMKEVNMDEQERTMKKLIFANKQLREDLSQEIERYNLLEDKFRDLLIKMNLTQKQNEKNQKLVFSMGTGANMQRYDNFLDEGTFNSSNKKPRKAATYVNAEADELNSLNKDLFEGR